MIPSLAIPKKFQTVSATEMGELVSENADKENKSYVVVDLRGEDFSGGHIPGAVNVPFEDGMDGNEALSKVMADVDGYDKIIFTCMYGKLRSPNVALSSLQGLDDEQSKKVFVLAGGNHGYINKHFGSSDLLEDFEESTWSKVGRDFVHALDAEILSARVKTPK